MEERPVSPHTPVLFLTVVASLFAGAQVLGLILQFGFGHPYVFGLRPLFDLDREYNLPSFFSATLLLVAAGLLALEALAHSRSRQALPWWGLSLLFSFAAADEATALHERLILPLQKVLGASDYLFFAWVLPYGAAVLVLAAIYLPFFLRLPAATRRGFFAAAAIYLGGAVGLEMIGGHYYEKMAGVPDLRYSLLVTVEELLEMGGVLVFVHTLLAHLGGLDFRIRFTAGPHLRPYRTGTAVLPPEIAAQPEAGRVHGHPADLTE